MFGRGSLIHQVTPPCGTLIAYAYNIPPPNVDRLITGGPNWLDGARYDVEARAESPPTHAQMKVMLQSMLTDRFKLRLHREERDVQGYALVVARGGPTLQESRGNEPAGMRSMGGGPVTASKTTMAALAKLLELRLGQPVEDRTGLMGMYNFTLSWTPGTEERPPFGGNLPPDIREKLEANRDASGTTLFTALQEQLGLRLQSQRVRGEILVIENAQRPSEN